MYLYIYTDYNISGTCGTCMYVYTIWLRSGINYDFGTSYRSGIHVYIIYNEKVRNIKKDVYFNGKERKK